MPSEKSASETVEVLARFLRTLRFHYINEVELQDGIEIALGQIGAGFTRELKLPDRYGRIDFMVHGPHQIGIEIKVAGSVANLGRQVARYLDCSKLDGIIVVTSRSGHVHLKDSYSGKPAQVVWVSDGAT